MLLNFHSFHHWHCLCVEQSQILPYMHIRSRHDLDLLVPCVLVTKVLPRLRMLNMAGALTSYQSFLEKGSTLHDSNGQKLTISSSAQTKILNTELHSEHTGRLTTSKPAKIALKCIQSTQNLITSNLSTPNGRSFLNNMAISRMFEFKKNMNYPDW